MPNDMETKVELSRASQLNAVGAQLFGQGELEPARLHFLAALSLEPNHGQALQNVGAVLRNLGHYEAAAAVARRSVAVSPGNMFCLSNLGVSELGLKRYASCEEILKRVVDAMPQNGASWHNYGLILHLRGKFREALWAFNKALEFGHDFPAVRSDRALTLLALQEIQLGLEAYEVRWEILSKSPMWDLGVVEWKGEPVVGRSILVHHEQGFGDGIMLARFLYRLVDMGAIVTMAVPRELVRLFDHSFGDKVTVVDIKDERIGKTLMFDYHTPILSLMRWVGVRTQAEIACPPYLRAQPGTLIPRLPKTDYRVGLCWTSGDHGRQLMDRRRIVPLTSFLPLVEIPGVSVISLQKGAEVNDIPKHGMEGFVFDLSPRIDDFADTAEIISALDMVISVDSAVAHVAGALGIPCIMLSPYTRCWRWWNRHTGRPWYDHMTIVHQQYDGSWQNAVDKAIRQVSIEMRSLLA